jgi:CopG family nickel-responsive transcriptional regulator
MPIVSLSFPEQMIKEMDEIQTNSGFTGRSELVRAAIRLLLEDSKEKDTLTGKANAIILVTHDEIDEAPITKVKHEFDEIVKTHIHNKIGHTNCVELFVLDGDGKRISKMAKEFQREDKMKSVKLIVI